MLPTGCGDDDDDAGFGCSAAGGCVEWRHGSEVLGGSNLALP